VIVLLEAFAEGVKTFAAFAGFCATGFCALALVGMVVKIAERITQKDDTEEK